jgi:hypothetical protein
MALSRSQPHVTDTRPFRASQRGEQAIHFTVRICLIMDCFVDIYLLLVRFGLEVYPAASPTSTTEKICLPCVQNTWQSLLIHDRGFAVYKHTAKRTR